MSLLSSLTDSATVETCQAWQVDEPAPGAEMERWNYRHDGAGSVDKATPAGDAEPRGQLIVQLLAMSSDQRQRRHFRRLVVSQMDIGGGTTAREVSQGRAVTVVIGAVTFIRPVKVGDVPCVYPALGRIGRSSITIHVEAWAQRFHTRAAEKGADARFTFCRDRRLGAPEDGYALGGDRATLPQTPRHSSACLQCDRVHAMI